MAFFLPLGVILYHLYQLREPEKNQLFSYHIPRLPRLISHGSQVQVDFHWLPRLISRASQVDFHGFPGWFPRASQVDFHGSPGWFPRLPRLISHGFPGWMKYDKKQIQSPRKDPHSFFLGDLISQVFSCRVVFFGTEKNRCFVYIVQESCPKHDNLHFVSIDQVEELELFFQVFDEHSYIQKQHSTTFLVHPSFGTQCSFQGKMDHNRFWLSQEGIHVELFTSNIFPFGWQSNHLSFAMTGPSNF